MQLLNTSGKAFCTTHQKYVVQDAEDEKNRNRQWGKEKCYYKMQQFHYNVDVVNVLNEAFTSHPELCSRQEDKHRIKSRLSTFAHKHCLFTVDLRFKN